MTMVRIPIWVNLTVALIILTAYARFISIWIKFWIELYYAVLSSFTWTGIKESFKEAFAGFTIMPICDYLGPFGAMIKRIDKFLSFFSSPFDESSDEDGLWDTDEYSKVGDSGSANGNGVKRTLDDIEQQMRQTKSDIFKELQKIINSK